MTWNYNLSEAPQTCAVILNLGAACTVVCEATREDGIWSGNAMGNIGDRIQCWAALPVGYGGKETGPTAATHHGSGRPVKFET